MESDYNHFQGFTSYRELQHHRTNYPFLKRLGSRRRHSTYGLSLVELENLVTNCIKTRISLNEYPDPLVISQDMLASIGVVKFSMINCLDLESGNHYTLQSNQTMKSHIALLGQLVQIVECYITCHQVATIFELEKWICCHMDVEEFCQLGVGPVHLMPCVVYYFRYLSTEPPYNVTLKSVLLGLNEFLGVLETKKEPFQHKSNLCVEFVEFFIHYHNYSHPDRLGLIINNIDQFIKNWIAVSTAQMNMVDVLVEELKQKYVCSVTKQMQQYFNTMFSFIAENNAPQFSDVFQNIPLFTLIENTIQYMNCLSTSTNLKLFPNDVKKYEKYLQQLLVQLTSKIKHNVDRQFLSDIIVMGSLMSVVDSSKQRNESPTDCNAVIDNIILFLNNRNNNSSDQTLANPKNFNPHSLGKFINSFLNKLKFSLGNITRTSVVSFDNFFRAFLHVLIGVFSDVFEGVYTDSLLNEQTLQEIIMVSPLIIVNDLSYATNPNNLSNFVSNIITSINREIFNYQKYCSKDAAYNYFSASYNIDEVYLRSIYEKSFAHNNLGNYPLTIVRLPHFFKSFRSKHSIEVNERLDKFHTYLYINSIGNYVLDIQLSLISLTDITSAFKNKCCNVNPSDFTNFYLVETFEHCYLFLKTVTVKELDVNVEDSFKQGDPFKCSSYLVSFMVSSSEFWHQVPICLILKALKNAINTVSMDYTLQRNFLIDVLVNLPSKINTFLFLNVFHLLFVDMFDNGCDCEHILKFAFNHVKTFYGHTYCIKFVIMAMECLVEDLEFFFDLTRTNATVATASLEVNLPLEAKITINNDHFLMMESTNNQIVISQSHKSNCIDDIKKRMFGINSSIDSIDPILKIQLDRQGRGLLKLASELYSNRCHFVLELIQNFDDSFSKNLMKISKPPDPSCAFIVTQSDVFAISNESGFDVNDVEAICDVGSSTKFADRTTIGCKGIGFKSVFSISNRPEIHSGEFHFKFDSELYGPIGYILPEKCDALDKSVVDLLTNVLSFQTCIRLPLKPNVRSLRLCIEDFIPMLLFLRNIKSIKLLQNGTLTSYNKIHAENYVSFVTSTNQMNNIIEENNSHTFFTLTDINTNSHSISVSFRIPSFVNASTTLEDIFNYYPQHEFIYCFLPVRSYGFNFIIQAKFELSSSREEVVLDSSQNIVIFSGVPALFAKCCRLFVQQPLSCFPCQLCRFALLLKYIPGRNSYLQTELFFVRRIIFDELRLCEFVPCLASECDSDVIVTCPSKVVVLFQREWLNIIGKFFHRDSPLYLGASIAAICKFNRLYLLHPKITSIISNSSAQYIKETLEELGCNFFHVQMIVDYLAQFSQLEPNFVSHQLFALMIDLLEMSMLSPLIFSKHQNDGSRSLNQQLMSLRFIPLHNNRIVSLSELFEQVYYVVPTNSTENLSIQNESLQHLCKAFLECATNKCIPPGFTLLNGSVMNSLQNNHYCIEKIEDLLVNVFNFKQLDKWSLLIEHIFPLFFDNIYFCDDFQQLYIKTFDFLYSEWKSGEIMSSIIKENMPLMCMDEDNNRHVVMIKNSKVYSENLYNKLPLRGYLYIDQNYYSTNFVEFENMVSFFEYLGVLTDYLQIESVGKWIDIIGSKSKSKRAKLLAYLDEYWLPISHWLENGDIHGCNDIQKLYRTFEKLAKTESWIVHKLDGFCFPYSLIPSNKCPQTLDHPTLYKFLSKISLTNKAFQTFIGATTKLTLNFCFSLLGEFSRMNSVDLPPLSTFTTIYMAMAKGLLKECSNINIDRHTKLIYLPQYEGKISTHISPHETKGHMYSSFDVYYNDKLFCSSKSLKFFYPQSDLKTLFIDYFHVELSPRNYFDLLDKYLMGVDANFADMEIVSEKVYKFFIHYTRADAEEKYCNFVDFHSLYDQIEVKFDCHKLGPILKAHPVLFSKILNVDLSQIHQENICHIIIDDIYLENYLQYFRSFCCIQFKSDSYQKLIFDNTKLSIKKFRKCYAKLCLLKMAGFELLSNLVKVKCGVLSNYYLKNEPPLENHFRSIIDLIFNKISDLFQSNSILHIPKLASYEMEIVSFDDHNPFLRVSLKNISSSVNNRMFFLERDQRGCLYWYINFMKTNLEIIPKITLSQLDELLMEFEKLFRQSVPLSKWKNVIVELVSDLENSCHVVNNQSPLHNPPQNQLQELASSSSVVQPLDSSQQFQLLRDLPKYFNTDSANKFTDYIGRIGEQVFNDFIICQTHFNKNKIISVEWINADQESFLPYDFIVTVEYINTTASYFVEVKSTSVWNKNHFFLSLNELSFAMDNNTNYFICRVFVDASGDPDKSQICDTLGSIVDKISCKELKLILAY